MIVTPASKKIHGIYLEQPLPGDNWDAIAPLVFASIEPSGPGTVDEDHITHLVKTDYHPQITVNTRIRTEEGRYLYVRGIQDVELRHIELWLLCEEVLAR